MSPLVIPIVLCGQSSFFQAYNGFNLFCGPFFSFNLCRGGSITINHITSSQLLRVMVKGTSHYKFDQLYFVTALSP